MQVWCITGLTHLMVERETPLFYVYSFYPEYSKLFMNITKDMKCKTEMFNSPIFRTIINADPLGLHSRCIYFNITPEYHNLAGINFTYLLPSLTCTGADNGGARNRWGGFPSPEEHSNPHRIPNHAEFIRDNL